jgi:O-antigen ligase
MKMSVSPSRIYNCRADSHQLSGAGSNTRIFVGWAVFLGLFFSFAISFNLLAGVGILVGLAGLILFCQKPVMGVYAFVFFSLWERVTILPEFTPAAGIGYLALIGFVYNVIITRKIQLKRTGQEWSFIFFLVVIFVSAISALDRALLFDHLFTLLQLMILFYLITQLIDSEDRLIWLLWIILFATLLSAGFAFIQRIQSEGGRVIGVGRNPNYTSATMIMGMFVALVLLKRSREVVVKYAIILSGAVLLVALLFTYSRGGLMAFVVGGGYIMFSQRKKGAALLVGIILVIAIIVFMPAGFKDRIAGKGEARYSSENRIEQLKSGLIMIKDHPWTGVGLKNFEVNYARYVTPVYKFEYRGAHNTYIQLGAEIGLPGLVVFFWILLNTWISLRKVVKSPDVDDHLRYIARMISAIFISYLVIAVFAGMVHQKDFWVVIAFGTTMPMIVGRISDKRDRLSA